MPLVERLGLWPSPSSGARTERISSSSRRSTARSRFSRSRPGFQAWSRPATAAAGYRSSRRDEPAGQSVATDRRPQRTRGQAGDASLLTRPLVSPSMRAAPSPRLQVVVLALVVSGVVLAGCGKSELPQLSRGGPAGTAQLGAQGAVGVATKNTTRLGGGDPATDAAAVARAVYPGLTGASRPQAVVLVDERNWPASLLAAELESAPLRAPLLYADGDSLPGASVQALRAMRPVGAAALGRGPGDPDRDLRRRARRLPHPHRARRGRSCDRGRGCRAALRPGPRRRSPAGDRARRRCPPWTPDAGGRPCRGERRSDPPHHRHRRPDGDGRRAEGPAPTHHLRCWSSAWRAPR